MTSRFISLMDQKAIVLYLHTRGMLLEAIHEDVMRMPVLGENAVAYSTVRNYVRSQSFLPRMMDLLHSP
jgi:hypothetical protein